jgi:hypothetical protein
MAPIAQLSDILLDYDSTTDDVSVNFPCLPGQTVFPHIRTDKTNGSLFQMDAACSQDACADAVYAFPIDSDPHKTTKKAITTGHMGILVGIEIDQIQFGPEGGSSGDVLDCQGCPLGKSNWVQIYIHSKIEVVLTISGQDKVVEGEIHSGNNIIGYGYTIIDIDGECTFFHLSDARPPNRTFYFCVVKPIGVDWGSVAECGLLSITEIRMKASINFSTFGNGDLIVDVDEAPGGYDTEAVNFRPKLIDLRYQFPQCPSAVCQDN